MSQIPTDLVQATFIKIPHIHTLKGTYDFLVLFEESYESL